jgi:hypothetical protein
MDMTKISTVVSLLIALSIASERLVEIVKGCIPALDQPRVDPTAEGRRRAVLQLLAVVAGIVTAFLASGIIPSELHEATTPLATIALGLLASGGSGFWNSILTYVGKVKDVKSLEASMKDAVVTNTRLNTVAGAYSDVWLGEEKMTSNECYDVENA